MLVGALALQPASASGVGRYDTLRKRTPVKAVVVEVVETEILLEYEVIQLGRTGTRKRQRTASSILNWHYN